MKLAITGAAGYLGQALLRRLETEPSVEHVLALDVVPLPRTFERLHFVRMDVRDPALTKVLEEHECAVLVHLAFVVQAIHNIPHMYDVNVRGSYNVFQAAARAGVHHVVNLSSYTVYGAWPDNPPTITEEHFPRPVPGHHYAWHKLLVEKLGNEVAAEHDSLTITHLRAAIAVGPTCTNNLGRSLRAAPLLPVFRGAPSALQLIHEEDLVEAIWRACTHRTPGVFNVGGADSLPWAEIIRRAGRRGLVLPSRLWEGLIGTMWHLRLPGSSTTAELALLRYPLVVDWSRAQRAWGWAPRYTTGEAVAALLGRGK